jgi:hypothetical protein
MIGIHGRLHHSDLGRRIVEVGAQVLMQRSLVSLQSEDVVAALIHDLLGNCTLTVERIRCHNRTLQRQHHQQLRHRGDLVGFGIPSDLRQHEALLAAPGADHVQRRFAAGVVERTVQYLSVDRDHALDALGEPRHEPLESGAEMHWVQLPNSRLNVS